MNRLTFKVTKSIRIKKKPEGKATGYWKGITATEKLVYEISVGISSKNSDNSSESNSEVLKSSLETGWKLGGEAEVKGGIPFFAHASVKVTGGKNSGGIKSNESHSEALKEIASMRGMDKH